MTAGFRDADELRSVLGELFDVLSHDPAIGPALRRANTPQRFVFTDLDVVLDVAAAPVDGPAALVIHWGGDPGWEPVVTMRMASSVANGFFQGAVNPVLANATGKIRTTGDFRKALELAPLVRPAFSTYRALLEARGLRHLLA
jgi:hypothetical protein